MTKVDLDQTFIYLRTLLLTVNYVISEDQM